MSGVSAPPLNTQDRAEITSLDALGVGATGQFIAKTGTDTYGYATAVVSMNGLLGAAQTFATGSTGTDFAVVSSGTTHTLNIPDASGSARGLMRYSSPTPPIKSPPCRSHGA